VKRTQNRTEYGVLRLWERKDGRQVVVGFRARRVTLVPMHRSAWVGPRRSTQEEADMDARTAALQHIGAQS